MNLITKIDGDYKAIGLDIENMDSIDFDDLVGMKFKLVHNNDYYEKTAFKTFMPTSDLKKAYNSKNSITLTIKAIVRENADSCVGMLANGIAYSDKLTELVVNNALNSDIVKEQKKADYNVLTRESLDKESKSSLISYLGGDTTPYALMIYPKNFDAKDQVIEYLDSYNDKIDKEDDEIVYTDMAHIRYDRWYNGWNYCSAYCLCIHIISSFFNNGWYNYLYIGIRKNKRNRHFTCFRCKKKRYHKSI